MHARVYTHIGVSLKWVPVFATRLGKCKWPARPTQLMLHGTPLASALTCAAEARSSAHSSVCMQEGTTDRAFLPILGLMPCTQWSLLHDVTREAWLGGSVCPPLGMGYVRDALTMMLFIFIFCFLKYFIWIVTTFNGARVLWYNQASLT